MENNCDIKEVLAKKKNTFIEQENEPESSTKRLRFKSVQSLVQQKVKVMQDFWWGKGGRGSGLFGYKQH